MTGARVIVYNPNFVNPYAYEVGSVLSRLGFSVSVWSPVSESARSIPGVRVRRFLAAPRRGSGIFATAFRRFWGPLATALSAGRRGILVVAWVKDPWDARIMKWRARLVGRTVAVYHNPYQVRGDRRDSTSERALMKSAQPVVHSERLRGLVLNEFPDVRVVGHPAYSTMIDGRRWGGGPRGVFAFVGELRPDKGADLLPQIAHRSGGGWTVRFLGSGPLPDDFRQELEAEKVTVINRVEDYQPSDDELVEALLECAALLAPYTAVTTSGSMILARSLGLPVITADDPTAVTMPSAAVVEQVAAAIAASLSDGPARVQATGEDIDAWAMRSWHDMLEECFGE